MTPHQLIVGKLTSKELEKVNKEYGIVGLIHDMATGCLCDSIKKITNLPKLVDYQECFDTDHDHGAWTDRMVFEVNSKFYEVFIDYFGQGETDDDNSDWENKKLKEVFPHVITKTIYK